MSLRNLQFHLASKTRVKWKESTGTTTCECLWHIHMGFCFLVLSKNSRTCTVLSDNHITFRSDWKDHHELMGFTLSQHHYCVIPNFKHLLGLTVLELARCREREIRERISHNLLLLVSVLKTWCVKYRCLVAAHFGEYSRVPNRLDEVRLSEMSSFCQLYCPWSFSYFKIFVSCNFGWNFSPHCEQVWSFEHKNSFKGLNVISALTFQFR